MGIAKIVGDDLRSGDRKSGGQRSEDGSVSFEVAFGLLWKRRTPHPPLIAKLALHGDLSPQERGEVVCACSCVERAGGASASEHLAPLRTGEVAAHRRNDDRRGG